MPTKSAGSKKRLPSTRQSKSEKMEVKERPIAPLIDLEETDPPMGGLAPAAALEEDEVPAIEVESELFGAEEASLDDDELNPFGDKWEQ